MRLLLSPSRPCSTRKSTSPTSCTRACFSVRREMALESWATWAARTDPQTAQLIAQWAAAGLDLGPWQAFTEERAGWIFARWTLTSSEELASLPKWLATLLSGALASGPDPSAPGLKAQSDAPTALIRTFPMLTSPASLLTLCTERPTTGYLFSLAPVGALSPPTTWDICGCSFPNAALYLLGLPISDPPLRSAAFDFGSVPLPSGGGAHNR